MWCVMICLKGRVEREWSERNASAKHADETLLGASVGGAARARGWEESQAPLSQRRVIRPETQKRYGGEKHGGQEGSEDL
jgi:hypothetical protein